MQIDWPWRPVPELRDLPRDEQKRIWQRCSGRAVCSWRFAFSMGLSFVVLATLMLVTVLLLMWLRHEAPVPLWMELAVFAVFLPTFSFAMSLTMQPWVKETRARIRAEWNADKETGPPFDDSIARSML